MLISHRKKFIYTKTLKTASSSVGSYFEKYCMDKNDWLQEEYRKQTISEDGIIGLRSGLFLEVQSVTWFNHMPAETIKVLIGEKIWNSYFKFCTIRNPYTKLISLYNFQKKRYLRRENLNFKKLTGDCINILKGNYLKQDFERFLESLPIPLDSNKYIIESKFCLDDYIVFEDLNQSIKNICEKLDLKYDKELIPHFKKGKTNMKASDYYSNDSKKYVSDYFEWELNYFNYSFPL